MLEPEQAGSLTADAGMRNLLVYDYLDVDLDRVWEALERLDDLRCFAAAAERAARK